MRGARALSTAMVLSLSSCSSFNMAAKCSDTGAILMRTLVVPNGDRPDEARLARIMSVSTPHELDADYNRRSCSAEISAFGKTLPVTYEIRQSEGVRNWVEVSFPDDPAIRELQSQLRAAYAS